VFVIDEKDTIRDMIASQRGNPTTEGIPGQSTLPERLIEARPHHIE